MVLSIEFKVPKGSYFASGKYPPKKVSAIQWAIEIGNNLAKTHPEIADFYRDTKDFRSYLEIAQMYIPEIAEKRPMVASKAIGYAVRQLIPTEEQEKLTSLHRADTLDSWVSRFTEEEWRGTSKRGWQKRQEMYGTPLEALIRGRGQIPWSDEEREDLFYSINNPKCHHQSGHLAGHPDFNKIAPELNTKFHQGENVRTPKSVRNYTTDLRRKNKKKAHEYLPIHPNHSLSPDVQQLSLYELALQRKQAGEPLFHEQVLIYHPASRKFANELREIGQQIYHMFFDEIGTLKELKRDERSQNLSEIFVDFPKQGLKRLIVNSASKYPQHIWGEPTINR